MRAEPWNKGRAVGPMMAFSKKEVALIVQSFTLNELYEECLFMVAIDSMLRCSDLLQLRVKDIRLESGIIHSTPFIRQKKTSRNVCLLLSDQTKLKCVEWIEKNKK